MTERDLYYDNLKGLLMILVVFCHFVGCCMIKSDVAIRALILLIYFFHMPLFIFVSGFFSKNVDKGRDKAFRELFLVFVVAQVFWVIFKYLTNGSVYYIENFLDPGYAIWYIVSLFFWRLFLKDLVKIKHVLILSFLISPLIMFLKDGAMILAINKTVGFLFFFLLGYYASTENISKLRRIPKAVAIPALLLIYGGILLLLQQGVISYGELKAVLMHTQNMAAFENTWLGLAAYYGALLLSLVCCVFAAAATPAKKCFLTHIGGDTLPLYLSHTYFLILCEPLLAALNFSHLGEYGVCLALCALLIFIFSTTAYRRLFHGVYDFIIGLIYPKSTQKTSNPS